MNKKELILEAQKLDKQIKSGKLTKKALHKAKKRRYFCLWRAGLKGQAYTINAKTDANQLVLPGFLQGEQIVALKELIINRMADQIISTVTKEEISKAVISKLSKKKSS